MLPSLAQLREALPEPVPTDVYLNARNAQAPITFDHLRASEPNLIMPKDSVLAGIVVGALSKPQYVHVGSNDPHVVTVRELVGVAMQKAATLNLMPEGQREAEMIALVNAPAVTIASPGLKVSQVGDRVLYREYSVKLGVVPAPTDSSDPELLGFIRPFVQAWDDRWWGPGGDGGEKVWKPVFVLSALQQLDFPVKQWRGCAEAR